MLSWELANSYGRRDTVFCGERGSSELECPSFKFREFGWGGGALLSTCPYTQFHSVTLERHSHLNDLGTLFQISCRHLDIHI